MDETLESRALQLAEEFASSATTIDELNGLMRLMMKSGLVLCHDQKFGC